MLTEAQKDPAYLIVKEWIPADLQAKLFEHTRKLKEEQAQGFTTDSRDGKRYFVRRRGKGPRSGTKTFAVDGSGRSASSRHRHRYAGTGLMRRAGSKDARGTSREQLGLDLEIRKLHEERESLGRRPEDAEPELEPNNVAEAQPHTAAGSDREQGHENTGHGDSKTTDGRKDDADAVVHDIIVTSDDLSRQSSARREPSADPATSRIKAMETMLLYRAMLFACLLATGTDTSDLLWLENRNRVVQVL
jgi:hypothetical protein